MEALNRSNNIMIGALLFMFLMILAIAGIAFSAINKAHKLYDDKQTNAIHICSDQTHRFCDGECECDGMECKYTTINPRSYQLQVEQDYALLFDGDRFVDTVRYEHNPELDNTILTDNY